ncbi:MAG: hypothetical protein GX801_10635 [Fibrobacter sp.]|nr:hypothetical protein [Fibrobacter sp.]
MMKKTLICGILLGILWGCYSFSATSLPAHIKSVRINNVVNQSSDPALGVRLQQGIEELFRREASAITIVTDDNTDADAEFSITLLSYSNNPDVFSRDATVETYRSIVAVSVLFQDNIKNEIIYEARTLNADGQYDVLKNESEEEHGQRRAIERLQELIITNALARW